MDGLYYLDPRAVAIATPEDKPAVLREVARLFASAYDLDGDAVLSALLEREEIGSTGFGRAVALPHARIPTISRPVAAVLRLARPVDFSAADDKDVVLAFGLLSPAQAGATHLHALASISRLLRDERMHAALCEATEADAIYALLSNVADRDAA